MMTEIMDPALRANVFFKGFEASFVIYLMRSAKLMYFKAGEFIYSAGQPPNRSRLFSAVYLIIEGRINCLGARSICVKTYIGGSYFGDIEYLNNSPRLFSMKAECFTKILFFEAQDFRKIMTDFPGCHATILKRSIKRYIYLKRSNVVAERFDLVNRNDIFWNDRAQDGLIKARFEGWLENLQRAKEEIEDDFEGAKSIFSYKIERKSGKVIKSPESKRSRKRRISFNHVNKLAKVDLNYL